MGLKCPKRKNPANNYGNGSTATVYNGLFREMPPWLKELCIFGSNPQDEKSNTCQIGLFAQQPTPLNNSIIADPVGLIRLFIKHHQYGEACDVVVSILSKQTSQKYTRSSRLPET